MSQNDEPKYDRDSRDDVSIVSIVGVTKQIMGVWQMSRHKTTDFEGEATKKWGGKERGAQD